MTPAFLIVGTPRSGTTLVQRLVSELPQTRVTPETHFFATFFERHLLGTPFPLTSVQARRSLEAYASESGAEGLHFDVDDLMTRFTTGCRTPLDMFDAVVEQLARDIECVGEKTPKHLRWWRPLSAAAPDLKFVVVQRDPRAVIASWRQAPFGMTSLAALAATWAEDVHETDAMRRTLSADRVLVVRYEQLVDDPMGTQDLLRRFLDRPDGSLDVPLRATDLFPPSENGWKARSLEPVDPARRTAWRATLTTSEVARVETLLRGPMARLGYARSDDTTAVVAGRPLIGDLVRYTRNRRSRLRQRRAIERVDLRGNVGPPSVHDAARGASR